jgi:hypothetical protein
MTSLMPHIIGGIMTNDTKMTFIPAVYALPNTGDSTTHSFPAASPDNIPLYAAPLPPSFPTWDEAEQFAYLRDAIREHYVRNRGILPFMGKIVAYVLHRSPQEAPIPLSVEGLALTPSESGALPHISFTPHDWKVSRRLFINSICSKDENTFH